MPRELLFPGEKPRRRVSRKTRQNIFDLLRVDKIVWHGRMEEIGFLERLWDLSDLPSTDRRYEDAAGDIHQHRVNNWDWEADWVFSDSRFDLLDTDDETFLAFLCETVHPLVREDPDEVQTLVELYNDCLSKDRVQLVPVERLGGRAVYGPRYRDDPLTPTTVFEFEKYPRLEDPAVLHDQLRRIDASIDDDPAAAIGASKELVESVCRIILDDYGVTAPSSAGVVDLYKLVATELALNAEAVPANVRGSQAAQQTLRTLVTTIQSLAELRNALGTGHGRQVRSPALARHGRLAFHAAVTVSDFLLATWHVRRAAETRKSA